MNYFIQKNAASIFRSRAGNHYGYLNINLNGY